jgi:hypothetical protein
MSAIRSTLFVGLLAGLAWSQEERQADPTDLPTACELRAYLLDADRKPCDLKEVKGAWIVFSTEDGKKRRYPMTLATPSEKEPKDVAWDVKEIDGTPYRIGVLTACTWQSVPGGNTHHGKDFIRPARLKVTPERRTEDEPKSEPLPNCPYYKVYLDQKEIQDLKRTPYTDVFVVFRIKDDEKETKCFSCSDAVPPRPDKK